MVQPFQDNYPDDYSHCFGCGRLNDKGLHIKSYWEGEEAVAVHVPDPHHIGFPGYVYGGLIASLVDCHAIGTAAAAAHGAQDLEAGAHLPLTYVTASLKVDYLKPTPMGHPIELRARIDEIKGRKTVVSVTVTVNTVVCARGAVVAVTMPDTMVPGR